MSRVRNLFAVHLACGLLLCASLGCSSSDTGPVSRDLGGFDDAGPDSPLTSLQPRTWSWVPFHDAYCRDGSATGIGVNANPTSDKLMIFLEGGGACFNTTTCALNRESFDAWDFNDAFTNAQKPNPGVFNRDDVDNPVSDWNFVYIPYCTGDVHAGANPNGSISLVGSQKFVGYTNMTTFLRRIVPTFGELTEVLLTGVSAGGFGATANYVQVAKAFGAVPVYLLDDSGPYMDSPYVAPCLMQSLVESWKLQESLLRDCAGDCVDPAHYFIDYQQHVTRMYPSVPMGLIDSTGDSTIAFFFGFGANDCTLPEPLSAGTFAAGLQDIRAQMSSYSNFGSFVFSGDEHTTLEDAAAFDVRAAGDTKLTTWISSLVAGRVTNVGP